MANRLVERITIENTREEPVDEISPEIFTGYIASIIHGAETRNNASTAMDIPIGEQKDLFEEIVDQIDNGTNDSKKAIRLQRLRAILDFFDRGDPSYSTPDNIETHLLNLEGTL